MSTLSPPKFRTEWQIKGCQVKLLHSLMKDTGLKKATVKSLLSLGLETAREIHSFLNPDFEKWTTSSIFPSLKDGVSVLHRVLGEGKIICVHGDFDTDGVIGAVVLHRALKSLGYSPLVFIPTREMGHGISEESVEAISKMGADVIMTVDCGIAACSAVKKAVELGLEVIITDHHLPDEVLPSAIAIINPQLDGSDDDKNLCGAAVALKVSLELAARLGSSKMGSPSFRDFLHHALVMTAIATIGDVVALKGLNRMLVFQALQMIGDLKWPGIKNLIRTCGFRKNTLAEDFAFQLIPRLNAAQRMGQGELIWELFSSEDEERAKRICRKLSNLNDRRKTLQKRHTGIVLDQLEKEFKNSEVPAAIVVVGKDWIEGLSGLIASRIVSRYARPTAVILCKDGVGKGSMRTPPGYHLKDALDGLKDILMAYGGHQAAAGFSINEEKVEAFKTGLVEKIKIQEQEKGGAVGPKVMITDDLAWSEINLDTLSEIQKLEPFGHANPRPIFGSRRVFMDGYPRYIGSSGEHAIASLCKPGERAVSCIAFNLGNEFRELDLNSALDVVYNLGMDKYRGGIQLSLVGVRQSEST